MRGFEFHARTISNIAFQQEAGTGRVRLTGTAPDGKTFTADGATHREATFNLKTQASAAGYEVAN